MEKIDFTKDILDYDWLKKGNVDVRSQNNRTIIINRYLKIEKPDFETLRKWILEQHKDNSESTNNNSTNTEKISLSNQNDDKITGLYQINCESSKRYIFDKSPTVEFKTKKLVDSIKTSRFNLIMKLKSELSSKRNYRDYDGLSLFGGLSEMTRDLSCAFGGTEILDDVDPLSVRVMFLLNQFILKNRIDVITKEYALIRGLMQDILSVQSNLIRLRASLNTFHIMSILGFDYLFDIDSLCLYLETLINSIATGIRSYIEKLWRVVHDFSTTRNSKKTISNELPNCGHWITSLEEIYSIIITLHRKHYIKPPHIKNRTLNPDLYFNLHNDATTLFVVNDLRNAHIHRDSPVSGADKEELEILINKEQRKLTRYKFYYSRKLMNKESLDGDFKKYLINQDVDLTNANDRALLYYRVKWRAPPELKEILHLHHYPTLFTTDLPQKSHMELKWEIPGINETFSYQEYEQIVLNINSSPIKDINKIGFCRISVFNLSDSIWSLFNTLKRLLKAFLIKKIYNREL